MSLFGDLDIEAASDNPWEIPADKYGATVSKVEKKDDHVSKNNPDSTPKNYMVIEYTITDGSHAGAIGQTLQEWKKVPKADDEDKDRSMSFIKQRLLSLGVPESKMNSVQPDDLVGIDVYVNVGAGKNGMPQVNTVELKGGSATTGSTGVNPFK